MKKAGFILVIDSYLVRKGLVSILNRIPGIAVLQEFHNSESLASYLLKHSVDFIIISQSLFEASADLFIRDPALLEKSVLLKDGRPGGKKRGDSGSQAHSSIHMSEEKEKIEGKIQELLNLGGLKNGGLDSVELSPRETTIVRLVSMGLTNRQIADNLFLSAHTVMTHRKNISSKLGIKSVSGLTVYAIVNNIITIEEVTSLPA